MTGHPALRIGTRGSPLALTQTGTVIQTIRDNHPQLSEPSAIEMIVVTTTGDRVQHELLSAFGGKGLFTKELDDAMLDGRIDIAIHSMKDMPTIMPDGISASAIMPREDVRDAFISNKAESLAALPAGSRVGTASLRRAAQVLNRRPDLKVVPFRGNVDTRLRKLDQNEADATFLAVSGLKRLGKDAAITCAVPVEEMLPAVGQGALCATCRTDDLQANAILAALTDEKVTACVMAERAMLVTLDGSCHTPIAGYAEIEGTGNLRLRGMIAHPAGHEMVEAEITGPAAEAERLGVDLGNQLLLEAPPSIMTAIEESRPDVVTPHPDMEQEQ